MPPKFSLNECCAVCKGSCCKRMPGSITPEDTMLVTGVDSLEEAVRTLLSSGDWAVDCWEGDPRKDIDYGDDGYLYRCMYLRPKTKDALDRLFDASWGGECVFLTDAGCKLPEEKRPTECSALEPKIAVGEPACICHFTKHDVSLAWVDHQDVIKRVLDEIKKVLDEIQ